MKEIEYLKLSDGSSPLEDWLYDLDMSIRGRIMKRLSRLPDGNLGHHKKLTSEISELKFDFGSGYRIYYTEINNILLLLINGGDKSSQSKDIQKAQKLLDKWKEVNHD